MLRPEIHLIDGENLVFRYQAMLEDGFKPKPNITHEKDVYVWHPNLISERIRDIRRATLYTSASGDEKRIIELSKEINKCEFKCKDASYTKSSAIYPKIYKKKNQGKKSRAVDINIVIDALTHINNNSAGKICIYSGDSDFIPLIEELMRLGAQVEVLAFSSGLSPKLEVASDGFYLLDNIFFEAKS